MPSKQSMISSILEDLTHLQVDTIIKSGMIAVDPPERVEDLLKSLHNEYVCRIAIIIRHNDVDFKFNPKECQSFEQLFQLLDDMQAYFDRNSVRIEDSDFIILQRIYSFCEFIKPKKYANLDLYSVGMKTLVNNTQAGNISTRDLAKLKRFHDLGCEKVVMQTRIGIDGDIIGRIEEEFAKKPLPLLVDLHDKHTNLSMKYWNSLVDVVVNLVTKWKDNEK
ncbi:hypothetical protein [Mangrovibacterium lignilyticum]|uniref:hypothetical protein n=1 Tax=Mangrovibacterium lignilyticum TaxID=2668052 RepID=UPI0013D22830|nr:hypothetical protein [Mangrovibacterium lignilyticum]